MIDTIRPDPDIPAALKAFQDKHGLKAKNMVQLLNASEEADMDALSVSPFLEKYLNAMAAITSKETTKMLTGEALHLATLIDLRNERQKIPEAARKTREEITDVLQGTGTGN